MKELEFLKKHSEEAVYDDLEGYVLVETKIVDEWRHGTEKEVITRSLRTGKKFWGCYRTSYDDVAGFYDNNCDGINFEELKEAEKAIDLTTEFLVFSDLHLHKFPYANTTDDGRNELLISGLDVLDQVYNYAIKNNVRHIIFNGDLFHIRPKVDSEVYCKLAYEKLCDLFSRDGSPELIMIPGNHDQIDKFGNHKLLPFSLIPRVSIVNDFYKKTVFADRVNLIFCPHQYKIENLYEYLRKNSDENSILFIHQLLMNSPLMNDAVFRKNEAVDIKQFKYNSIFSGHNHRPFENKDLRIFNVGSPMHIDFGDAQCQDRFFIHYKDDKVTWVKTKFPHFALQGTKEANKASYIRKKSKKVVKVDERVEINFNDDTKNIAQVYVETCGTLLDKSSLLQEGCRLLNSET